MKNFFLHAPTIVNNDKFLRSKLDKLEPLEGAQLLGMFKDQKLN